MRELMKEKNYFAGVDQAQEKEQAGTADRSAAGYVSIYDSGASWNDSRRELAIVAGAGQKFIYCRSV
jgi:hypothetical protein